MTHLNLEEALECAKNGETVYGSYYEPNNYFTENSLIDGILNNDFDYSTQINNFVDWIQQNEEDYEEWVDEKGKECNNLDEFFTDEYVKDYFECAIGYDEYEMFDEETLQELYSDE